MKRATASFLHLLGLVGASLTALPLEAQDFTRITEGPMVNDGRYSEGSSFGDINGDGLLDLFVPHAFQDRSNLLFINQAGGTFTQVTEGPVVTDVSTSSGASFGDFDNDGDLDLFVQNWNGISSHLYLNDGDGTFTKVTTGAIVSDGGWSFNSSVVDYDNDGNLDVYVDNGAFTTFVENNFLYRGNGDGTFTKVTSGVLVNDQEHCLSSSWCDYDNDGDQDLYTANSDPFNGIAIRDFLYQNNGDGTFTRVTGSPIVNDRSISIGGSWGDYDNDGDFDLFVANWYGENNHLYRNEGAGVFTRVTAGDIVTNGGDSVSGAWGDYDNDGDLDLYVANDWNQNNFLYRNEGGGTFARIVDGDIVNDGGRSNGATWTDYNNDGFLDLYVPNGQNPDQNNFLYRNNGLSGNHWINVLCVGTVSNSSAIGTRVSAKAMVGGQAIWQLREVSGHQGFNAQESFNVEFGLGDASLVDSLIFRWPSGIVEAYTGVEISRFYRATEGVGLEAVATSVPGEETAPALGSLLNQNRPNPFDLSTEISFEIAGSSSRPASLTVYDVSGRHVATLVDGTIEPGAHTAVWRGRDHTGVPVRSGVYVYVLRSGREVLSRKMIVISR